MSINLKTIFNKDKNITIGAIHFPPLLGYPDFPGMKISSQNALLDLKALEQGGADATIFENNYDIPHLAHIKPKTAKCMTELGQVIMKNTKLPTGVSVLWNDYKTALVMAKKLGLKFIRIPVFVDTVKTNYGIMKPAAKDAIAFRKKIKAEHIALFTDIHVKHSTVTSKHDIIQSAKRAIQAGSDALIITGKWTGDAPDLSELIKVRKSIGDFPIILGSGIDHKNIKKLYRYANGAIVSTSLKSGKASSTEVNLKGYDQRIVLNKVKQLTKAIK
jgi:membrane complex biogenesis BtpA family protein